MEQQKEEKNIIAKAKNLRITPRKAKLIIDLIRNKSINQSIAILNNLNKINAKTILKLVKSVLSNAIHNFKLDKDKLYISEIFVCDGPRLKRARPRAKGRSFKIIKRTCSIVIKVKEIELKKEV